MDFFQALVGGLFAGGLIGFIEFLIKRSDDKKNKNSDILKSLTAINTKIEDIESRFDKENADDARRNILVFDDELRRGIAHSEESFNQVLEDINLYSRYCHEHPKYENNKAVAAIAHIKETYKRVKDTNQFI